MQQFEIKFNESAETYGTLIGMDQNQEIEFKGKLEVVIVEFIEDPEMKNGGHLLKKFLQCATNIEEAIVAAFHAGQKDQQMQEKANPLAALFGAIG